MSNIQAILFDCDGVLVNTESIHMKNVYDGLNKLNYTISLEEVYNNFKGMNFKQIEQWLKDRNVDIADDFIYTASEISRKVPLGPEIAIKNIHNTMVKLKDVKKAVCSNGQIKSIEKKLTVAGLKSNFDVLVGAGEHPKPHPEVFLKAAAALQKNIYQCLAIEDSALGLKAAIASGAISVGYAATPEVEKELAELRPDFIIKDMLELVQLYKDLNEE